MINNIDEDQKRKLYDRLTYFSLYRSQYENIQKKGNEILLYFKNFSKQYKIEIDDKNHFELWGKRFEIMLEWNPQQTDRKFGYFIINEIVKDDGPTKQLQPIIEARFDDIGNMDYEPGTFQLLLAAVIDHVLVSTRVPITIKLS